MHAVIYRLGCLLSGKTGRRPVMLIANGWSDEWVSPKAAPFTPNSMSAKHDWNDSTTTTTNVDNNNNSNYSNDTLIVLG